MKSKRLKYFFVLFAALFCFGMLFGIHQAKAATLYINSSTGNDSTGNGSSGSPYKTFTKGYASSTAGDILNLTGTFTWTDAAETTDVVTTGFTLAKNLTIQGQLAGDTIIQAATASSTTDRRVFTVNAGVTVTFDKLTIRNGNVSSTSYYGGGIYNSGTVTITNCDISSNVAGAGGGGIANLSLLTLQNSSVRSNTSSYSGGGIRQLSSTATTTITSSTITYNTQTSSSVSTNGGGINIRFGVFIITNSTISYNTGYSYGGGVYLDDPTGVLYMSNTIISNNTTTSGGASSGADFGKYTSSVVYDNGYNIVGTSNGYSWAATGDWTDTNADGTFAKQGGGSGTLNLENLFGVNDNPNKTNTLAITAAGSIAVNNGTTTANSTVAIPSTDQRGAGRSGATDIGAFEYGGTGLSIVAPSTQTSAISFSTVQYNRMTLSWTAGSGSRRAVFIKQASSGTASPVDGTQYTASTTFASGSQIGSSGWYTIYDGLGSSDLGTSIIITGLTQGTTYIVQAFEYNGIGSGASVYFNNTANNNPNTQQTHAITTIYSNSTSGNDSTGDGSSGNPYQTFNKGYTIAQAGDTLNLAGTFTWTDAGETGDAVTSGYTISKDLIIDGNNASTTIVQAGTSSTTPDRRVFTVASGITSTIKNITIRNGRLTGASQYGSGILNNGTLTVTNADINNNYNGDGGGGIGNMASLVVQNSSFWNNTGNYSGGAIRQISTSATMTLTNSTFFGNHQLSSSAYTDGGAIGVRYGAAYITNCTIAYNDSYSSGGLYIDDPTGVLYMSNTIIAKNTSRNAGSSASSDFGKYSGAAVYDNGYNMVGRSSGFTWNTVGDWTDTDNDNTFTKQGGGSASSSLDTALNYSNNPNNTYTLAIISASSAANNNGTTTANSTVTIPSTDQRGAARVGSTDIGAYEYGGVLADLTAPTVSLTAPSNSAILNGSSVTLTATSTDNTAVAGVTFYVDSSTKIGNEITATSSPNTYSTTFNSTGVSDGAHTLIAVARDTSNNQATTSAVSVTVDNTAPTVSITTPSASSTVAGTVALAASASDSTSGVVGVKFYIDSLLIGSEDTSAPYGLNWDSTTASNTTHTVLAVARDTANNIATSSTISFSVDNTSPNFSSIIATATNSGAIISWTSSSLTSSQINFGLSTSYSSSTPEANTSPRVSSHSVTVAGLPSCTQYHFQAQSKNAALTMATSTDGTFVTLGCTGSATVSSTGQGTITTSTGGSLTQGNITVTVPTAFTATTSAATFQALLLDGTTFFASAGAPSGKGRIGSSVYNLKALIDATTTLTAFTAPLTITMSYSSSDVSGYDESSLKIHRYDGSTWFALNNCAVNTTAKTVTCETNNFSDFAIFGQTQTTATSSSGGGGLPSAAYVLPIVPLGGFKLSVEKINNDKLKINTNCANDIKYIAISLNPDFKNIGLIPYSPIIIWDICTNKNICPKGKNIIYAKFYTAWGQQSDTVSTEVNFGNLNVYSDQKQVELNTEKFLRNLQKGNRGADVSLLQYILAKYTDIYPSGLITGFYGSLTEQAVQKFQTKFGIAAKSDLGFGKIGPLTRAKLNLLNP